MFRKQRVVFVPPRLPKCYEENFECFVEMSELLIFGQNQAAESCDTQKAITGISKVFPSLMPFFWVLCLLYIVFLVKQRF